jgi:hypothetical protein
MGGAREAGDTLETHVLRNGSWVSKQIMNFHCDCEAAQDGIDYCGIDGKEQEG